MKTDKLSLDTDAEVFFYEQEFYVLSNFSAFNLNWRGVTFDTSEAAYQWEKFRNSTSPARIAIQEQIRCAPSAHEAFKIAERFKELVDPNWHAVKADRMREILYAKVNQHEYVKRKLVQSGDRKLIENSWRDSFWGWGPDREGKNMLGRLWMEIREELSAI